MKRDDEVLMWVALGVFLLSKLRVTAPEVVKAMEKQGTELYERMHPGQKAHANHLPGKQMTRAQIRDVARAAGFPEDELDTMVAIAMRESGGVPGALEISSREHSVGLWQINMRAHGTRFGTEQELKDPLTNARAAYVLSRSRLGLKHWSAYKSGRYRDFLPGGAKG